MRKMLLKSFFVILVSFLKACESLNQELFLDRSIELVNDELVEAVNYIIEEVYLPRFTTVNILSAVENPNDAYYRAFKHSLLLKNKGFCIYRLDNHTHIQMIRFRLKIYNVILLDSIRSFDVLYSNIQPDKFNFRGCFLFVLVNGIFPEVERIFSGMWSKFIMNVNVLYDDNGTTTLATFKPYDFDTCSSTSLVTIATFNNGSFGIDPQREIFPDKLKNMHSCNVRLVTFQRCPAVCLTESEGEIQAKGFDMEVINLISSTLNFTLQKEILLGDEQWGTIYANKTTTGALAKIVNGEADIGIGNYLLRASRLEIMDSSMVYFSFPVVFAIPLGERLSPFEKLMRPFEFVVWVVLAVFLSIGVIVILIVNWRYRNLRAFIYGTGVRNPIINMLIAIFGGSQPRLPRRNFSRYLLMMFLMFCLVKRNVYQGALYIFLQSDGRHAEVQSIDEMAEKGFDFHMYESYSDIIESQPKIFNQ